MELYIHNDCQVETSWLHFASYNDCQSNKQNPNSLCSFLPSPYFEYRAISIWKWHIKTLEALKNKKGVEETKRNCLETTSSKLTSRRNSDGCPDEVAGIDKLSGTAGYY